MQFEGCFFYYPVEFIFFFIYNISIVLYRGVAQMVARLVRDHEAASSNLVTPTITNFFAICTMKLLTVY
jgi:hypothetical protein